MLVHAPQRQLIDQITPEQGHKLQFEQRALRIESTSYTPGAFPVFYGRSTGEAYETDATPVAAESIPDGKWRIRDGLGKNITHQDLVTWVGDPVWITQTQRVRKRRQRTWGLGFGLGGAAALAGGITMRSLSARSSLDTVGTSLIALGGVGLALSLLTPWMGQDVLSRPDAEYLVNRYNQHLRAEYGIAAPNVGNIAAPSNVD